MASNLLNLVDEVENCKLCTRLVNYRSQSNSVKPRRFADWTYWARPVPGFGDPQAALIIIGLAPATHGGNRTGRLFTGDPSARFLIGALHQQGFANQPNSEHRHDGLILQNVYITAALHCAPPKDKPTPNELRMCLPYLTRELEIFRNSKAILVLGRIAFDTYLRALSTMGHGTFRIPFVHGTKYRFPNGLPTLYVSYHPSPRNTNTGRLTAGDFQGLLKKIAVQLDELDPMSHGSEPVVQPNATRRGPQC